MAELDFPKSDGDAFFASEANGVVVAGEIVAGENLTAGNIVYIKKNDGKAYLSDTGTADDIRADGIALNTATTGNDVDVLKKGSYTITATAGEVYYLGAAGAISTTVSGVEIGVAIATNKIFVDIIQDDRDTLGTIKAWLKTHAGTAPALTAFWKECDGTAINDAESPLNFAGAGEAPDLNSADRFLRGNATSDDGTDNTAAGGTTSAHTHTTPLANRALNSGQWVCNQANTGSTSPSIIPSFISVVWIMKIK